MKHCYSDSSGNVLLDGRRDGIWQGVATGIKHSIHKIRSIFSPKNKSNSPILRQSGPAKIPSCIEPVWHSGSFPRWKQLLQLRFGNYHCHLDSFGYLRIFKGRKVNLSNYRVLFRLLSNFIIFANLGAVV